MSGHHDQVTLEPSDNRLYQKGMLVSHTSDDSGLPDVGISVGLGQGKMLYAGELPGPNAKGWSLVIYGWSDRTVITTNEDPDVAIRVVEAVAGALCRHGNVTPRPAGQGEG